MSIGDLLSQSLLNYDGDPPGAPPTKEAGVGIEWDPPLVEDEWTLAARVALEKFSGTHKHQGSI